MTRGAGETSGQREATVLRRPRLIQGMLLSGIGKERVADSVPYGVGQALNLNSRSHPSDWEIVRYPSGLIAKNGATGAQIDISANSWEAPYGNSRRLGLRFRLAIDDAGLIEARQLLERSHPRRAPASGIYLLCHFTDADEQEHIRVNRRQSTFSEPWSSAWNSPKGAIVGCIVISRLFHGNPSGREHIRKHIRLTREKYERASRRERVQMLGVAWISRIGVDAPYRGLGIGEALAAEALQVAKDRLPWQPKYLEVIRTVKKEEVEIVAKSGDFLTRAGYHRSPDVTRSSPLRPLDAGGNRMPATEPCRKLYYWSPVK